MRVSPRWLLYGKEEMNQYPEAALPRFTAREKLNPQELQNETVAYLSGMDLDDQNVWLATITAAANKSRRNKQEEKVSKDQGLNAHDPTSGKRHALKLVSSAACQDIHRDHPQQLFLFN
jgi:chaperonin GroEL (HSP60 family)